MTSDQWSKFRIFNVSEAFQEVLPEMCQRRKQHADNRADADGLLHSRNHVVIEEMYDAPDAAA